MKTVKQSSFPVLPKVGPDEFVQRHIRDKKPDVVELCYIQLVHLDHNP